MKKYFEINKTYAVYGKPASERQVVALATCINDCTTKGKAKFRIQPMDKDSFGKMIGKELKRGWLQMTFNCIESLKDGVEHQFCQHYYSDTDKWITINSINVNE